MNPKSSWPRESPGERRVRQARNIFVITALVTVAAVVTLYITDDVTPETIRIEAVAKYAGETLRIAGSTSLPPGAIIGYEVLSRDGDSLVTGKHVLESDTFEITVGEPELRDRSANRARLSFEVVMEDGLQPPGIVERYGSRGQRMTGETVRDVPHGRKLIWIVPINDG
jgi:hypothetical protein